MYKKSVVIIIRLRRPGLDRLAIKTQSSSKENSLTRITSLPTRALAASLLTHITVETTGGPPRVMRRVVADKARIVSLNSV